MLFFKYLKKHNYESEKTRDTFFAHTLFQICKKASLQVSKIPETIFMLIPFFKCQENHIYESENTWDNFYANMIFSNIQKTILTNLKNTWDNFFAHTLFQIFRIAYLQI